MPLLVGNNIQLYYACTPLWPISNYKGICAPFVVLCSTQMQNQPKTGHKRSKFGRKWDLQDPKSPINRPKMVKLSQKWPKWGFHDPKSPSFTQKQGKKRSKLGQKCQDGLSKARKHPQNRQKMVKTGPKCVKRGPQRPKITRKTGQKWSQMAQIGQNGAKIT